MLKLKIQFYFCHSIFSNKLWPDDEQNSNSSTPVNPSTPATPPPPPSRERSDSGIHHSTVEDENTTDWTPEIPFENVSNWKYFKICIINGILNRSYIKRYPGS